MRHGLRQSLMTNQLRLHLLRVALAVTGIQFWLWALAVPVPIWQGIALLMTSPVCHPGISPLSQRASEPGPHSRDPGGVCGRHADPGSLDRRLHPGLPAAGGGRLFWAGYSLLVRYQAASESSHTIVVYLLVFSTPFSAMLAILNGSGRGETQWLLVAASGVLSALAQMSIARAYSVAEASFVQPFDFAKLPMRRAGRLAGIWLGAPVACGWGGHHHRRHHPAHPSGAARPPPTS